MLPNYKSVRVFHCCMVLSLSYLASIYIDAYTSPIENELLRKGIFTEDLYPIFVAVTFTFGALGSFLLGTLSERLGCKTCIIIFSPLAIIGSFLLVLAHDSSSMILGKAMIGTYQGVLFTNAPVYNAEVSPLHMRKFYGSAQTVVLRLGVPLSYFLGIWLNPSWLALVYMIVISTIILNIVFVPESPKWLQENGFTERATRARRYFYNSLQDEECQRLTEERKAKFDFPPGTSIKQKIKSYFVWPVLRPMLVCSTIHLFKTSSGYELLLSFISHSIQGGVSIDPNVASLFFGIFLVFGSILFLLIHHKVSWKKLLLVTTLIQAIANFLLALMLHLSMNVFNCSTGGSTLCVFLQYSPVFLTSIFGFTMALGWGSLSYWLMGEILHHHYTRISAGIVMFISYTSGSLNQAIGGLLVEYAGSAVVFMGSGIVCLIGFSVQCFY